MIFPTAFIIFYQIDKNKAASPKSPHEISKRLTIERRRKKIGFNQLFHPPQDLKCSYNYHITFNNFVSQISFLK
jgi:hypothetical protein